METKSNYGRCPKCHTEDIQYDEFDCYPGEIRQTCVCNRCDCKFEEHYHYTHQVITEDPEKKK